jgi:mannose-6-phosphate isomerase-like protein (cupin superfamily)
MSALLSRYDDARPYATRDGSEIRELMHPQQHGNRAQSLAEATVYPGQRTLLHLHRRTEELYHVTVGQGTMILGDQTFAIGVGDTIPIPPGTPHALHNTWPVPLRVLCSCSPAYDHADTEILVDQSP